MSKQMIPNTYKPGEVVYAKTNPSLKLIIRRYLNRVYYCRIQGEPDAKELVYYERELFTSPSDQ